MKLMDIPARAQTTLQQIPRSPYRIQIYAAASIAVLALVIGIWLMLPPRSFPANTLLTIPTGSSAAEFAHILKDHGVIHSELAFRALARVTRYDHHLDPGAYVFARPVSLISILQRIGMAQHGIDPVRITFTEGMTRYDMAHTLQEELPGFDPASFLQESSTSEGYLFPETYLFMPGDPGSDIVMRLKLQFSQSIATITPNILASSHPFPDAVIMASILEREARSEEDKRIVAGILWNRIAKRMPLQVDAAFGYAHQENGYTPTAADLESDSPYNTYIHYGLPPTAISNPGIESLLAAVMPAKTTYLYYLTGTDGKMHYANTFEEHKKNIQLYLDR